MRKQNLYKRHSSVGAGAKKRIILGIAGGFGSGKTTVAKMFKSYDAKIIDADKIAHALLRQRSKIHKKIIRVFGTGIVDKDNSINRSKLAKIVFSDKNLLNRLNKIMHPAVIKIIKTQITASQAKIIVLDAPLLIEAGIRKLVDKLIIVNSSRGKQIERASKKTSLSKIDIVRRIKSQFPLQNKVRLADFVIDNNGTIKKTKKQVEQIRRQLWKN